MGKLSSAILMIFLALSLFADNVKVKYAYKDNEFKRKADEYFRMVMNSGLYIAKNGKLVNHEKITYKDIVKKLENPIIELDKYFMTIEGKLKGTDLKARVYVYLFKKGRITGSTYYLENKYYEIVFSYLVPYRFGNIYELFDCGGRRDSEYCNNTLNNYFGNN